MASHIERRKFLATLGGAAAAWPVAARAQQPAMPVVGFLHSASLEGWAPIVEAFRDGRAWGDLTMGRAAHLPNPLAKVRF